MAESAPAMMPGGKAGTSPLSRPPGAIRARLRDGAPIRWMGTVGAVIPVLALAFILVTLVLEAWPAIIVNGWKFFISTAWNPGNAYGTPVTKGGFQIPLGAVFGALPFIVGTLVSSLIALIIAVPVSIGAALIIVERLPRRLAYLVGLFLELLAGIPSVIIGLWGVQTFGPFFAHHIARPVASAMPNVPVLKYLGGSAGNGQGMLISGLVLSIMVIPIIAATARDLIRQVPVLPREGAIALGMSDFETARRVTLPWAGPGIIGAIVLGLGRALGETVAVAMISGAATGHLPSSIYDAFSTISAVIVDQLDGALTDSTGFFLKTLAELGLVLMVITLAANIGARVLVRRASGTALPVGRGV
jgi:phosphate transport system permease protein